MLNRRKMNTTKNQIKEELHFQNFVVRREIQFEAIQTR